MCCRLNPVDERCGISLDCTDQEQINGILAAADEYLAANAERLAQLCKLLRAPFDADATPVPRPLGNQQSSLLELRLAPQSAHILHIAADVSISSDQQQFGPAPWALDSLTGLQQCCLVSVRSVAVRAAPVPTTPRSPSPAHLRMTGNDHASTASASAAHADNMEHKLDKSNVDLSQAEAYAAASQPGMCDSASSPSKAVGAMYPARGAFGSVQPAALESVLGSPKSNASTTNQMLAQQPTGAITALGAAARQAGTPSSCADIASAASATSSDGAQAPVATMSASDGFEDGTIAPGAEAADLMRAATEVATQQDESASEKASAAPDGQRSAQDTPQAATQADGSFFGYLYSMVGGSASPRATPASPQAAAHGLPQPAADGAAASADGAGAADGAQQPADESRSPPLGKRQHANLQSEQLPRASGNAVSTQRGKTLAASEQYAKHSQQGVADRAHTAPAHEVNDDVVRPGSAYRPATAAAHSAETQRTKIAKMQAAWRAASGQIDQPEPQHVHLAAPPATVATAAAAAGSGSTSLDEKLHLLSTRAVGMPEAAVQEASGCVSRAPGGVVCRTSVWYSTTLRCTPPRCS